jgi:hypothetical protein
VPGVDRDETRGAAREGYFVKTIDATLVALFVGLAVVTQGHAEDYYIYQTPNGALVISNKEPPPGSKIIKQLPGVTEKEVPQAQEPVKRRQTERQKAHRSPLRTNSTSATGPYIQSFKSSADCVPRRDAGWLLVGLNVERESVWLAT